MSLEISNIPEVIWYMNIHITEKIVSKLINSQYCTIP